jgi:hypothetical protein
MSLNVSPQACTIKLYTLVTNTIVKKVSVSYFHPSLIIMGKAVARMSGASQETVFKW